MSGFATAIKSDRLPRSVTPTCMLWRLAKLICQLGEAAHRHAVLHLEEHAEQRRPSFSKSPSSLESSFRRLGCVCVSGTQRSRKRS